MALRFVLTLGYLALCSCSPVLINDYIFRDGRGFAIGQARTYGQTGQATGYATVNNNAASAYGSASSKPLNDYNGYAEAVANAEAYYNTPYYSSANAAAENAPAYYVPAPVSVVSYEQSFEVPKEYVNRAESSSVLYGNDAVTSAKTEGQGYAQANGVGDYGITSSNANSFGQGSASSTANNAYGTGTTATRTQGYGSAHSLSQNNLGTASSNSQSNGGASSAYSSNNADSSIATTNTQGFGSASSNVQNYPVNDYGKNQKKIGWHIGTSYSIPPKRVQAVSQSYGGSAKSSAYTNKYGNTHTTADTQGHASANSNSGYGNQDTNSVANSNGYGTAKSSAGNNYGSLNSHSSSSGQGYAQSSSNHAGYGYLHPSSTNAQTSGSGSASSVVKGVNASYRVAESNANSYGSGMAQANSYSY